MRQILSSRQVEIGVVHSPLTDRHTHTHPECDTHSNEIIELIDRYEKCAWLRLVGGNSRIGCGQREQREMEKFRSNNLISNSQLANHKTRQARARLKACMHFLHLTKKAFRLDNILSPVKSSLTKSHTTLYSSSSSSTTTL